MTAPLNSFLLINKICVYPRIAALKNFTSLEIIISTVAFSKLAGCI